MRIDRRLVAAVMAACVATSLTACATSHADDTGADPADARAESLRTRYPTTVIDDGSETLLCPGAVLQSLPPQCADGVRLVGWQWEPWIGHYDEAGDVRWGDFTVAGVWNPDAEVLSVARAVPAASDSAEPIELPAPRPRTTCREPDDGWTFYEDPDDVLAAENLTAGIANSLPGFATLWTDASMMGEPPAGSTPEQQLDFYATNAGRAILNVGVQGDIAQAEEKLRAAWRGALCVYEADFVASEKEALVQQVVADYPVSSVGMDSITGEVSVTVTYDGGGMLQHELDARYGAGSVQVDSWLEVSADDDR